MHASETFEDDFWAGSEQGGPMEPVPGLILIFSVDRPAFEVIPLEKGAITLGRGKVVGVSIADKLMSKPHARVAFDGRRWKVQDMGSRNGTAVDGEPLSGERAGEALSVLRTGSSLFLLAPDTRPFTLGVARTKDSVQGPSLQRALKAVARAARFGRVLHVTGESGSGKEIAARAFHDVGPQSAGPFVAVNGAALPEAVAERLLFGSRPGAYTNATDAQGYFQSADGGTLFLDEVAEVPGGVQGKLLRAIEKGEVMRLGGARLERVDVRFCSATNQDLRAQVAAGKMREDLFFRIGVPTVALPPLRERPEEIPWLVERAIREIDPSGGTKPHVSLVEACLRRRWPGNVRELIAEVRAAAQLAVEEQSPVGAKHLGPSAGSRVGAEARRKPTDEEIAEALRATGGVVSRAAKNLGMHRTQLVRWIERRIKG